MKGEPSLLTTRSPGPSQSNHSAEQLWEIALGQLQLQMTRATFESWVKDTHIVSQNGDMLVVGTKSDFAKDWLENRLYTTVSRTVTNILGRSVTVSFVVDPDNGTSLKPVEVPLEESSDLTFEAEAETTLTHGHLFDIPDRMWQIQLNACADHHLARTIANLVGEADIQPLYY